jgi:hypothetical protein
MERQSLRKQRDTFNNCGQTDRRHHTFFAEENGVLIALTGFFGYNMVDEKLIVAFGTTM